MKLPLSWLSDYTDMTGITPKEYDAKLTMSVTEVELADLEMVGVRMVDNGQNLAGHNVFDLCAACRPTA